MKRNFSKLAVLFFLLVTKGMAQYITQDIDGYSTLIVPTANFSYGTADNILNFSFVTIQNNNRTCENRKIDYSNFLMDTNFTEKALQEKKKEWNKIPERKYVWGGNAQAKNKDGLSVIYADKKLNPTTKASAIMGVQRARYVISKNSIKNEAENFRLLQELKANKATVINKLDSTYELLVKTNFYTTCYKDYNMDRLKNYSEGKGVYDICGRIGFIKDIKVHVADSIKAKNDFIKSLIDDLEKLKQADAADKKNLNDNINKQIASSPFWCKEKDSKRTITTANQIDSTITIIQGFKIDTTKKDVILEQLDYLTIYLNELFDLIEQPTIKPQMALGMNYHSFYIVPQISASSFTYDLNNGLSLLDKGRFSNKTLVQGGVELVYNLQWEASKRFGASFAIDRTNNVNNLDSDDYSIIKVDSLSTNVKSTHTKNFTALSGSLKEYNRYSLNLDYIHYYPLRANKNTDSGGYLVGLSSYARLRQYQLKSSEKESNVNLVLGVGITIFNTVDNKLAGGAFLQWNDALSDYDQTKDIYNNKWQVGFVFRFAIKGYDVGKKE